MVMSLIILAALVAGGCTDQPVEPSTEPLPPSELPPPPNLSDPDRFGPNIRLTASTDKNYYAPGEEVEIELSFQNLNSYPVIVEPFPPEIEIWLSHLNELNKNRELIRSFVTENKEIKLDAGETRTYNFTWGQKYSDGRQVAPGRYYAVVVYFEALKASGKGPIGGGGGTPTRVLIQYPQGAMEKIIEVGQSQTITNLTFMWRGEEIHTDVIMTLERVELFAEGTRLFVLASSPHYLIGNPETHWDRARSPWDGVASAQYVMDGVIRYDDLRRHSKGFPEEGVRLMWGNKLFLDPVPIDAQELTFTVTHWGDWEGPWEFTVPLN